MTAIYKGTVNDPTTFPPPSKSHGSYHWAFERLLSASLIPLTAATFVTSGSDYPLLDGLLGVSLVMHSHIGVCSLPLESLEIIGSILLIRSATVRLIARGLPASSQVPRTWPFHDMDSSRDNRCCPCWCLSVQHQRHRSAHTSFSDDLMKMLILPARQVSLNLSPKSGTHNAILIMRRFDCGIIGILHVTI